MLREGFELGPLTLGGRSLRIVVHGGSCAQRTAVFLHDGLGTIDAWKEIPQQFATDYSVRVVIYDRWGYGGSESRNRFEPGFMEAEVPTLMEVIDAVGSTSVDLVGHSDGATIALLAAAWHPRRVRSVVSIAGHTFVEPETTKSIQALRDGLNRGVSPAWLGRLHGDRGRSLLEAWAGVWLGKSHAEWDVRGELSRVKCPVLALQGDSDEFGTADQLVAISDLVRDVEIWQSCGGHSVHHDLSEEFVRRVGEFWSRS